MLQSRFIIAKLQIDIVQEPLDPVPVLGANAHQGHMVTHRAVNRPGIHILEAQLPGHLSGHGTLSRACGAIHSHAVNLLRCHSVSFCGASRNSAFYLVTQFPVAMQVR